ncbi:MAG: FkbM family methyltransferase [Chitinophagales bacterium]
MIENLNKAEKIINATKWKKLSSNPYYYVYAYVYKNVIYPFSKKTKLVKRKTFFDEIFYIKLPAALDIFIYGTKSHSSEIRLAKFILKYLKPNNTFVDVGAHFGFFSLLAASILKREGSVISFEAAAYTFDVLKKNTENHQTIKINHKACSNQNEILDFYEFPIDYSEYNALNKKQYENSDWLEKKQPKKVSVQAVRLDEELKNLDIDIIKIDVEGAEFEVVEGMKRILENKKVKFIVLEFLDFSLKTSPHLQAAEYLIKHNFMPFAITKDGFLESIKENNFAVYLEKIRLKSDNIVFKIEE